MQRRDQLLRLRMVEGAIEQVHSHYTKRFLLFDVQFIEHPHVNDDLARLRAWLSLEAHTEPAVRFIVLLETARGHGFGKNEERAFPTYYRIEPFDEQVVLVIEHGEQALAAHITIGRSVNRVTESHVVGRDRFRDRAGRAADVKKSACDLLTGADLGKRAVLLRVQIDLDRLLIGAELHLSVHMDAVAAVSDRRKLSLPASIACAVGLPLRTADATAALARRFLPATSRADCSAARRRSNRRGC